MLGVLQKTWLLIDTTVEERVKVRQTNENSGAPSSNVVSQNLRRASTEPIRKPPYPSDVFFSRCCLAKPTARQMIYKRL
jgi:hypothetical protein